MTLARERWTAIAHADLALMSPVAPAALDELLSSSGLGAGDRACDLGCGKGELLVRLAERTGCGGIGVDRSGELLAEARAAAGARAPGAELAFVEGDAAVVPDDTGAYDLAAALGAAVTLRRLAELARPGGLVLLGEGYWRRAPSAAYLEALGARREELTSLAGTVALGEARGLEPLRAVESSEDDWDRYESSWSEAGERYAAAHAGEEGVDAFLAWIRAGRRRYLELGGRDTLGFALLLFRRP